jgi:predicted dinucleotide-binding enzyme
MNIAILGAGNVGGTLGKGLAQAGHQISYAVRDPEAAKTKAVVEQTGSGASAADVPSAVASSDIVLLCTPWDATKDALAGAGDLRGKVLLDCTNPLNSDLSLAEGHTTSGGEMVAEWARGARVVKIFNTTGSPNIANPRYGNEDATMFFCGDDAQAKDAAYHLARDLGFDPVDAGPLKQARLLEPLAMLWISLAIVQKHGVNIAFKLMHR